MRVDNLWTDRARFKELDEEAIEIQPMPIVNFPNCLSDVCAGAEGIVPVGDMDRDPLKVSMVGRDGFECPRSPLNFEAPAPELHIFKARR